MHYFVLYLSPILILMTKTYAPKARNPYISFAKAFSIITIVIYHYTMDMPLPPNILKVLSLGGGGVHLFIFASGFGLASSKYLDFKSYINKRFSKVYLPYLIAVTLIFLVNMYLHLYKDNYHAYLSHVFLYKMFFDKYVGSFGYQLWFISTIIQFYLVFPLLSHLVNKYPWKSVLGISIAISIIYAIAISLLGYGESRVVGSFFLQYLWEFVLGMVIARQGFMNKVLHAKPVWFLILSIVSYGIMGGLVLVMGSMGKNLNDIFSFLGYLCISIFIFKVLKHVKPLYNAILSVESISYSLFLTHYLVYHFFVQYVFSKLTPLQTPIMFVAALGVAYGFEHLVVRPLLSIKFPANTKTLIEA
jgi:peptidoglycan/LPS O-acetylase OafA/YrhL